MREEIAYVAGVVDGDGCITLTPIKRNYKTFYMPHFHIVNTNLKMIKFCQKIIGGRILTFKDKRHNRKLRYRLYSHNISEIIKILTKILPYLVTKKERAEVLLKFCKYRKKHYHKKNYGDFESNCFKEMKELINT